MVQLTQILCKYYPRWLPKNNSTGKRYFKKHHMYQMCAMFYGRSRNCYRLSMRAFLKRTLCESKWAKENRVLLQDLFSQRIFAACYENDYEYDIFINSLEKMGILLNLKQLANLAIWEPRSFKSLIEMSKAFEFEEKADPLRIIEEPKVVNRKILQKDIEKNT